MLRDRVRRLAVRATRLRARPRGLRKRSAALRRTWRSTFKSDKKWVVWTQNSSRFREGLARPGECAGGPSERCGEARERLQHSPFPPQPTGAARTTATSERRATRRPPYLTRDQTVTYRPLHGRGLQ